MSKVKLGQEIFTQRIPWRISEPTPPLEKTTVSSVGRKYFTTGRLGDRVRFRIADMRQETSHTPTIRIWLSEQDYLDATEKSGLHQELSRFFGWSGGSKSLSLDQLREIKAIIGEVPHD